MAIKKDFGTVFIEAVKDHYGANRDDVTPVYGISDLAAELRTDYLNKMQIAAGDGAELTSVYNSLRTTRLIAPFRKAVINYDDQFFNESKRRTLKILGGVVGAAATGAGVFLTANAAKKIRTEKNPDEHVAGLVTGVAVTAVGAGMGGYSVRALSEKNEVLSREKETRDAQYVSSIITAFCAGLKKNRTFAQEMNLKTPENTIETVQQGITL